MSHYRQQANFENQLSTQSFGVHALPWTWNLVSFLLPLSFPLCLLSGTKQRETQRVLVWRRPFAAKANFLQPQSRRRSACGSYGCRNNVTEAAHNLLISPSLLTTPTTLNRRDHKDYCLAILGNRKARIKVIQDIGGEASLLGFHKVPAVSTLSLSMLKWLEGCLVSRSS